MAEKTTATQRAADEGPPQRKISRTELARIVSAHEAWVESNGDSGRRADLAGADLRGADLRHALLVGAVLRGADLRDSLLGGAQLRAADLEGADLRGANLRGAILVSADLTGANLENAKLHLGDLRRANFARANLRGASLIDADLQGCNLLHADLRGAGLLAANLLEVDLTATDLAGAYLRSADLRATVNLTCDQLRQAEDWEETYRDRKLRCGARIPKDPPRPLPKDAEATPRAAWLPPAPPAEDESAPQAAAPGEPPPAERPAAPATWDAEATNADDGLAADPLQLQSAQIEPVLELPSATAFEARPDEALAREPEAEAAPAADGASGRHPAAVVSVQSSGGRSALIAIVLIAAALAAVGGWWALSKPPSAEALIESSELSPKTAPDAEVGDAAAARDNGGEARNIDGTSAPPETHPDAENNDEAPATAAAEPAEKPAAAAAAGKANDSPGKTAAEDAPTAELAALSPEAAATNTRKATLLGTFRDWRAFINDVGDSKICFIKSEPIKTETSIGREGARALLAQRAASGAGDKFSVSDGDDFRPETEVEVRIGDAVFKLQTSHNGAPGNLPRIFQAADPEMVDAMKRGEIMVVSGTTAAGKPAEDIYSLYGFTAAYDAMSERCAAE